MEFISDELDKYVCDHSENEPKVLHDLNRETHLNVLKPRMLSGHYQGRVLSIFSHLTQPKRILEIGSYTGYSAICLAEGMQDGGELITIDRNDELESLVQEYIERSENSGRIVQKIGDAMEIIPKLEGEFDLVFIDADKSNYLNYYKMIIDKVPSGGVILIDNVLWSGKVVEETAKGDKDTAVLKELNAFVHNDERVQEVILPIRDGLTVIRKK